MARDLTLKQKKFVEYYLANSGNGTQAVRDAGYNSKNPDVIARQLLRKASVLALIEAKRAKIVEKLGIEAEDVLRETARIAFSDIGGILDFSGVDPKLKPANEISEEARRSICSVKTQRHTEGKGDDARTIEVTEFRLWNKVAALHELAVIKGLHKPAPPVPSGPTNIGTINLTLLSNEQLANLRSALIAARGGLGQPPDPDRRGGVPAQPQ